MAPHSSTLAWKIPWMEEPGRLQSMGSLESDATEWLSTVMREGECPSRCLIHEYLDIHSEKAMAPHSSTLAWKIPWTQEPGGLQSVGSLRVRHDFTFTFHFHALEKEMATHSSVLAWRIPGTGEPGGLPFMGSHRVGHDWSDLAAASYYLNWQFSTK